MTGASGPVFGGEGSVLDPNVLANKTDRATDDLQGRIDGLFSKYRALSANPSAPGRAEELKQMTLTAGELSAELNVRIGRLSSRISPQVETLSEAKNEILLQVELLRLHRASAMLDVARGNVTDLSAETKIRTKEDHERLHDLAARADTLRRDQLDGDLKELTSLIPELIDLRLNIDLPLWKVDINGQSPPAAIKQTINELQMLRNRMAGLNPDERGWGSSYDTMHHEMMLQLQRLDELMTILEECAPEQVYVHSSVIDLETGDRQEGLVPFTTAVNAGDIRNAARSASAAYKTVKAGSALLSKRYGFLESLKNVEEQHYVQAFVGAYMRPFIAGEVTPNTPQSDSRPMLHVLKAEYERKFGRGSFGPQQLNHAYREFLGQALLAAEHATGQPLRLPQLTPDQEGLKEFYDVLTKMNLDLRVGGPIAADSDETFSYGYFDILEMLTKREYGIAEIAQALEMIVPDGLAAWAVGDSTGEFRMASPVGMEMECDRMRPFVEHLMSLPENSELAEEVRDQMEKDTLALSTISDAGVIKRIRKDLGKERFNTQFYNVRFENMLNNAAAANDRESGQFSTLARLRELVGNEGNLLALYNDSEGMRQLKYLRPAVLSGLDREFPKEVVAAIGAPDGSRYGEVPGEEGTPYRAKVFDDLIEIASNA